MAASSSSLREDWVAVSSTQELGAQGVLTWPPIVGGTVFTRSCGRFHPVHDTEPGKEKGGKRCLSALGSGEGKKEMGGGGDVLVIPCTRVPASVSWSCG